MNKLQDERIKLIQVDFDEKMRTFEDNLDTKILPNIWTVARLDGRSFSKLTNTMKCAKPFDDKFQFYMAQVVKYLMTSSGIKIIYGYTESDEISLLFSKDMDAFNRRVHKLTSILSSLAASVFTSNANVISAFDCRISQLPTIENVIDYFRWRQNDSARNALNGYCYWTLRNTMSKRKATSFLENMSKNQLCDLLMKNNINYNNIVTWHKNGTGFYWESILKQGFNPIKNEKVNVLKNILKEDTNLLCGEEYSQFIKFLCIGKEE